MPRPRSGGNSFYIAAADCPARLRAGADFVCDGVDDQVEIQAAIDLLYNSRPVQWNTGLGGSVILSPGVFRLGGPIDVTGNLQLHGSHIMATQLFNATDHPFTMLRWRVPHLVDEPTLVSYNSGTKTLTVSGISATANQYINGFIRIKRGLRAGEKRRIVSNLATSGGQTSFVLDTNFTSSPDATSKMCIDSPTEFSFDLANMTVFGNRYAVNNTSGVKAIRSTSYGAQTDAVWVDDGTNMVYIDGTSVGTGFPEWVVGCPLYIYDGTGRGQLRYIEGRATTNNTNDTLLLDGPWWPSIDGTSKAYIGGSALSLWGSGTSDLVVARVFLCNQPGWNFTAEYTWGAKVEGGYWEFADLGGMYLSQSMQYIAVTNEWNRSNTAGQQANIGLTAQGLKCLANGRVTAASEGGHGVMVYGRVIDCKFTGCEFGSAHENFDGVHVVGGYGGLSSSGLLSGCTFSSWNNGGGGSPTNAGVRLGSNTQQWAVVGCTCRQSATTGPSVGARIESGGSYHVIEGNTFSSPVGTTALEDLSGHNLITDNINGGNREQNRFTGYVNGTWDGTSIAFSFLRPLITVPTGCELVCLVMPRDAQTATCSWAASATATTLTIVSPNASSGTTTVDAVTAVGTATIEVVTSAMFRVGGQFVIDTGSNAETVTITSIPDGTHVRGYFSKTHLAGVDIKPRYRFWAYVEPQSRVAGNG